MKGTRDKTAGAGLRDRLRAWNRRRIAARRLRRPARETPFGFRMNGNDAMCGGTFEPDETALIRSLLRETDRFVNVGANMGFYCCLAQQAGVATTALEPVPSNVQIIAQNMRVNGWGENITVLPVAAGEMPGFIDIYGVGTGASVVRGWARNPESLKQTVPMARLDDLVRPPSDNERVLVVMDVEGFEHAALKGCPALVHARVKPVWLIELICRSAAAGNGARASFEMMTEAGYAGYRVGENLSRASEPDGAATNYLFMDKALTPESVIGPEPFRRVAG